MTPQQAQLLFITMLALATVFPIVPRYLAWYVRWTCYWAKAWATKGAYLYVRWRWAWLMAQTWRVPGIRHARLWLER